MMITKEHLFFQEFRYCSRDVLSCDHDVMITLSDLLLLFQTEWRNVGEFGGLFGVSKDDEAYSYVQERSR